MLDDPTPVSLTFSIGDSAFRAHPARSAPAVKPQLNSRSQCQQPAMVVATASDRASRAGYDVETLYPLQRQQPRGEQHFDWYVLLI